MPVRGSWLFPFLRDPSSHCCGPGALKVVGNGCTLKKSIDHSCKRRFKGVLTSKHSLSYEPNVASAKFPRHKRNFNIQKLAAHKTKHKQPKTCWVTTGGKTLGEISAAIFLFSIASLILWLCSTAPQPKQTRHGWWMQFTHPMSKDIRHEYHSWSGYCIEVPML